MIILLDEKFYVVDAETFHFKMDNATNTIRFNQVIAWIRTHPTLDVQFYNLDDHI